MSLGFTLIFATAFTLKPVLLRFAGRPRYGIETLGYLDSPYYLDEQPLFTNITGLPEQGQRVYVDYPLCARV